MRLSGKPGKSRLKRFLAWGSVVLALLAVTGWVALEIVASDSAEDLRYRLGETELIVSNLTKDGVQLFRAGEDPEHLSGIPADLSTPLWLQPGNYVLRVRHGDKDQFHPVPLTGYRCGPDHDGSFLVTVRQTPNQPPPRLRTDLPEFAYIPSGSFLLGDRRNPGEQHYVWLTGYYLAPFEVTNGEFRMFLSDSLGYANDDVWTKDGLRWKRENRSHVTSLLTPSDGDYNRFGKDSQPVVWVNWFEANAYCRWLTEKVGGKRWLFSLPNDAEWEKAARGPDGFDYALGMSISDNEAGLYNWRKNPGAPVTVVDCDASRSMYRPNRYGLYHITGNVNEWSNSVNRLYNRANPYDDDDRNHADTPGLRSVRGGSWYSAAISYLYIPYRDAFQPEHSNQELGFRITAKALP
jgi:formylglycine-generating enzyme required for sulfatase activity